jgi:hypothetical protein
MIGEGFETYTIDIDGFALTRYEPPLPEGSDANTTNKLVFFVNNAIADSCPKATLWFKNICFNSKGY